MLYTANKTCSSLDGLVMCACELMQAHAKQQTSQQYCSDYSYGVETVKAFQRKQSLSVVVLQTEILLFVSSKIRFQGCKFHPVSSTNQKKVPCSKVQAYPNSKLGEFLF